VQREILKQKDEIGSMAKSLNSSKKEVVSGPNIFGYTSYRHFLTEFVDFKLKFTGSSYRAFARRSGVNCPNYLQLIIKGRRNLTATSASKVSRGLGLKGAERKYFLGLVELEIAKDTKSKLEVMKRLKIMAQMNQADKVADESLHSSWINLILWEMTLLKDVEMSPDSIMKRLPGIADRDTIVKSLSFLISKGYLVPINQENTKFKQANIAFESKNDVENLNLQMTHMKFLDLAKDRLSEPLDQREYQGLTIAVSKKQLPLIKSRLRAMIRDLNEELSNDPEADNIVRVQFCMYNILSNFSASKNNV